MSSTYVTSVVTNDSGNGNGNGWSRRSWPMRRGSPQGTSFADIIPQMSSVTNWSVSPFGDQSQSTPSLVRDSKGYYYASDRQTGSIVRYHSSPTDQQIQFIDQIAFFNSSRCQEGSKHDAVYHIALSLDETTLFVPTDLGYLYGISLVGGRNWTSIIECQSTGAGNFRTAAIVNQVSGDVYTMTYNWAYAFTNDGQLLWNLTTFESGYGWDTPVVSTDGRTVILTRQLRTDSFTYAIDATNGNIKWRVKHPASRAGIIINVAGVTKGDWLYFMAREQTGRSKIIVLDVVTGSAVWIQSSPQGAYNSRNAYASMSYHPLTKHLLVPGKNQVMYAFDASNGSLIWQTPESSLPKCEPGHFCEALTILPTNGHTIFILTHVDTTSTRGTPYNLLLIDPQTGAVVWQLATQMSMSNGVLPAADGTVIIPAVSISSGHSIIYKVGGVQIE